MLPSHRQTASSTSSNRLLKPAPEDVLVVVNHCCRDLSTCPWLFVLVRLENPPRCMLLRRASSKADCVTLVSEPCHVRGCSSNVHLRRPSGPWGGIQDNCSRHFGIKGHPRSRSLKLLPMLGVPSLVVLLSSSFFFRALKAVN